jgi:hypothetical protein
MECNRLPGEYLIPATFFQKFQKGEYMFLKNTFLPVLFIGAIIAGHSAAYSQEKQDESGIRITLPDFPIVIGQPDDGNKYDKEGYDRTGYDRYGYDRYGYNSKGYDREGYDRNGYDIYGNQPEAYYEKEKKQKHDNGKHKGWYKKKKNKDKHDNDDDRGSTGTYNGYPNGNNENGNGTKEEGSTGNYNGNGYPNGNGENGSGTKEEGSTGTGKESGENGNGRIPQKK